MKKLYWLTLILFLRGETYPQWVQTNGPYGGYVSALAVSGTNLFAATDAVFPSANNGTSWTPVGSGLHSNTFHCLAVSGTNLLAGTNAGVFLSTNNGTSWTQANSGLTNTIVSSLAVSPADGGTGGTNLFAGTTGGVFLSTDNGTSWTSVNSGLTNNHVNCLAVSGTNLFAGTGGGGVVLSTNNGMSWTPVNSGIPDSPHDNGIVASLFVSGTRLFAGTFGGVFLSTDNGETWSVANSGLPTGTFMYVNCFAISGTNLFASMSGSRGVFCSSDNGASWSSVNEGLANTGSTSLVVAGGNLFAGTWGSGVWRRPLSEMITSVGVVSGDVPTIFRLEQNYPNPFNPSTSIQYGVSSKEFVSLKVYDVLGKEVATLVNEEKPAGSYEVTWYTENLSSGVYFYKLQAGSYVETKKMLMMK